MKAAKSIIVILVSGLFAACSTNPKTEQAGYVKKNNDSVAKPIGKDSSAYMSDGCTGAVPDHSIVDSVKYPNRKFHLAHRLGYNEFETVQGDSITIEHSNCDYSIYHFTIRTDRFSHELSDTGYWINVIADIINEIKPALSIDINLDSGLYYLRKYYSNKGKPLNTEIHFNDKPELNWMNVVTVENFKEKGNACSFKVTFYTGPL